MKFSVMSRNANPTARTIKPDTPTTDITAWVSRKVPSASIRPPITRIPLMIEPTTDRNRTLCTTGASSVSDRTAKNWASSHDIATIARAISNRIHLRNIVAEIPQLLEGEFRSGHHLFVGVRIVNDQSHTFHPRDDAGELLACVIIVDPAVEGNHAAVDGDRQVGHARVVWQELGQESFDLPIVDLPVDRDGTGRAGDRCLGLLGGFGRGCGLRLRRTGG